MSLTSGLMFQIGYQSSILVAGALHVGRRELHREPHGSPHTVAPGMRSRQRRNRAAAYLGKTSEV